MNINRCHIFTFDGLRKVAKQKMPPNRQVTNPEDSGWRFCDLVAKKDFFKAKILNIEIQHFSFYIYLAYILCITIGLYH